MVAIVGCKDCGYAELTRTWPPGPVHSSSAVEGYVTKITFPFIQFSSVTGDFTPSDVLSVYPFRADTQSYSMQDVLVSEIGTNCHDF